MARLTDWVDLGKNTISSLTTDDVTGLYRHEWRETREALLADHQRSIDDEPRRVRRTLRSLSAMAYGLVKRLSPVRRVVFVITTIWFFTCLIGLSGQVDDTSAWRLFEIGGAFVVMTILLAMELIGKIKFRDELTLARDLQATLIPKTAPATAAYDIAAFNHIANTVGGDLYDFVPLPDGRLAVLFGDASGHGMAAGLVMAVAHASFRTQLDIDPDPIAIISSLNRILCRTGTTRSFFTCSYVLLAPDGSFSATLAGHPPLLHVDAAGNIVERIGRGSYPLGIKNVLLWQPIEGHLDPGHRLVFHSDGLSEARDVNGRDLGDAYIESIINWSAHTTASGLVDALVGEWRKFTAASQPDDDVSIAVIAKR